MGGAKKPASHVQGLDSLPTLAPDSRSRPWEAVVMAHVGDPDCMPGSGLRLTPAVVATWAVD